MAIDVKNELETIIHIYFNLSHMTKFSISFPIKMVITFIISICCVV